MVLHTEILEATDLHIETLETEHHTETLAIAVHLTEALERPTEMARHTEILATADLHTEDQAETLHIEAQAAAVLLTEVREAHHTEALEDHLTEVQEVRLTEAQEAAHHTEAQEAALHTEAQEAAADEALAEAHEAEEAEDKPNAFKITILYKQTKHYNHEKVNCNSVFAHCGSCVGIGTKRV